MTSKHIKKETSNTGRGSVDYSKVLECNLGVKTKH